ncbi:MAG: hypothetical protein QM820_35270 [Minicystis sp.]
MRRKFQGSSNVFSTLVITAALGVVGCHGGGTDPGGGNGFSGPNPILFVTQVPVYEFGRSTALFGNHLPTIRSAPRGGDLHIIYPDGKLRNLTKEAGFGVQGLQGPTGIAVREPSVHWDGKKALFSMVVGGAKKQFEETAAVWQIYEVTGLGDGEDAVITRVPGQPEDYNNISPLYGTDDAVLFTSDRPRDGRKAMYPQLDEYESAPIVTGLWRLDPATGDLAILNHTASGLFSPIIDSAGRIVFTRWDHLQRDQQEAAERYMGAKYGTFTFVDESDSGDVRASNDEVFPEPLYDDDPQLGANQAPHKFNQFFPWMLNEDGSGEETLNHVGRHEFGGTYGDGVFKDDPNLTYLTPEDYHQNRYYVTDSGGMFHFKEDPVNPGTFYCTEAREFGTDSAGGILKITGGASLTAEQMTVTPVTDPIARQVTDDESGSDPNHPGHFRNPVPLADGTLIAAHTTESRPDKNEGDDLNPSYRYAFRLKHVVQMGDHWVAGDFLTPGIRKDVTYLDPDNLVTATGNLWELDPVEVRERERPARRVEELPAPEKSVLDQKSVDEQDLRSSAARSRAGADRDPQRHHAGSGRSAAAVQPARARRGGDDRQAGEGVRRQLVAAPPGRSAARVREPRARAARARAADARSGGAELADRCPEGIGVHRQGRIDGGAGAGAARDDLAAHRCFRRARGARAQLGELRAGRDSRLPVVPWHQFEGSGRARGAGEPAAGARRFHRLLADARQVMIRQRRATQGKMAPCVAPGSRSSRSPS